MPEYLDSFVVPLLISVTFDEEFSHVDSVVVYLDLTVTIFVAPKMDLEIVGIAKKWVLQLNQRFTTTISFRWLHQLRAERRFELSEARRWRF